MPAQYHLGDTISGMTVIAIGIVEIPGHRFKDILRGGLVYLLDDGGDHFYWQDHFSGPLHWTVFHP